MVPGSEFVVSRTAHRDNSSYYTVDRKRKTYKEVATILRRSGIDLDHNRFLILQVNSLMGQIFVYLIIAEIGVE